MVVSFAKHTVLYLLLLCEDEEIALVMELVKLDKAGTFIIIHNYIVNYTLYFTLNKVLSSKET